MRLIILITAAVLVSGCIGQQSTFSFESGKGYCLTPDVREFNYRTDGTTILFEGVAETPDPCVNLTATPSVAGKYITVVISGSQSGTCAECSGGVDFSGSIDAGKYGDYTFKVMYGEKLIFQSDVTLASKG